MNSNSRHYYWRKILGQNQALYAFKSITYFSAEFKCNLSFGHSEAHARSTSNQFVADLMRTIDSYLNRTLRSDEEGVGCVVQHGSSDTDRVPDVPDAAYCTHIVRRSTNQIPAICTCTLLE